MARTKRGKDHKNVVQLSMSIDRDLLARLDERAREERRSRSNAACMLLAQALMRPSPRAGDDDPDGNVLEQG